MLGGACSQSILQLLGLEDVQLTNKHTHTNK
jgi:hypothetical protein